LSPSLCLLLQSTPKCSALSPAPPVLAWSCAPVEPDADRGDGCPFRQPAAGERCRLRGDIACRYAEGCGYDGTDASCVGGRWSVVPFAMPPPP
ncbi:MAG: hypothetical protein J0L92_31965, partial [Deltaproteobacteria bacterium]|nr:hypothetical protein [Deltaproteobacteria bacterium]